MALSLLFKQAALQMNEKEGLNGDESLDYEKISCQILADSRVAHQRSGRLLWMKSARRESALNCSHCRHPRRGSDGLG